MRGPAIPRARSSAFRRLRSLDTRACVFLRQYRSATLKAFRKLGWESGSRLGELLCFQLLGGTLEVLVVPLNDELVASGGRVLDDPADGGTLCHRNSLAVGLEEA